ncbi:MAG: TIR domain-containing protein [Eubacteriales bacterium]|nr:TIR domain-containing protein [Eubacteriales bacterium]
MNHLSLDHVVPCDMEKPFIFISYSSDDYEYVYQDVITFQSRGYNIWFDEANLDKTQESWKEDALNAIHDYDCKLALFYVSESSLSSTNCLKEIRELSSEATRGVRMGNVVKFLAVETGMVGIIDDFQDSLYQRILHSDMEKAQINQKLEALTGFKQDIFNSNEKVRILCRNNPNRKSDYYNEIIRYFPNSTRNLPVKTPPALSPEEEATLLSSKLTVEHMEKTYEDGSRYVGESVKGLRHGNGKMYYVTGEEYVGQWVLDKKSFGVQEWGVNVYLDWDLLQGENKAEEHIDENESKQVAGNPYGGDMMDGQMKYSGYWQDELPNGEGTMIYINGDVYTGTFVNGLPDGQGVLVEADATRYEGNWTNGKRHGQGKTIWADGHTYEGQYLNNKKDGTGVETFADKSIYEGDYLEDQYNGNGRLTLADGSIYTGRFVTGRFHGHGEMTYGNGAHYLGEWKEGLFHGEGVYKNENGDVYEGVFDKMKLQGQGTLQLADGSRYNGGFQAGKYNGRGTMSYQSGDVYDGDWVEGRREGRGVLTFSDGSRYDGAFNYDVIAGNGEMRYRNGDVYNGAWNNGKRNGKGKMSYADGRVYEGFFVDDVINGKGFMRYLDGEQYDGEWINGIRSGKGKLALPDGRKYEGSFAHNRISGRGKMEYPNGDVYDGDWTEGLRVGNGIFTLANGRRYKGTFTSDHATGRGTITWPKEKGFRAIISYDRYEGEVVDGLRSGIGIMTWADESVYDGHWENDKRNGHGILRKLPEENASQVTISKIGRGLLNRFSDSKISGRFGNQKTVKGSVMAGENYEIFEGEWVDDLQHGPGEIRYPDGRIDRGEWRDGVRIDGE